MRLQMDKLVLPLNEDINLEKEEDGVWLELVSNDPNFLIHTMYESTIADLIGNSMYFKFYPKYFKKKELFYRIYKDEKIAKRKFNKWIKDLRDVVAKYSANNQVTYMTVRLTGTIKINLEIEDKSLRAVIIKLNQFWIDWNNVFNFIPIHSKT